MNGIVHYTWASPALLLFAMILAYNHSASICLSSWYTDESPPKAAAHSSREPSCRKACGGYNELGVCPGFPDL